MTKAELRSLLRVENRPLPEAERDAESARLRSRIVALEPWRVARVVLLFAPLRDELDVWPLVEKAHAEGKQVGLPSFDPTTQRYGARLVRDPGADLVHGHHGVREPKPVCPELPLAGLDFVLVPGLAFTCDGGRLGRGGGFYDRLLASTGAVRVGVGRDAQIVPWLPLEPHDAVLEYLVTPSATHFCHTRKTTHECHRTLS